MIASTGGGLGGVSTGMASGDGDATRRTLDKDLLDVLGPDLAAVLEQLVVLALWCEVAGYGDGSVGERLHAAVGRRGRARRREGGGEVAAAVGGHDFAAHGGWVDD